MDGYAFSNELISVKTAVPGAISLYVTRTDVEKTDYGADDVVYLLNSVLSNEHKEYLNKYVFFDYVLIPDSKANNYSDYITDFINSGYAESWYSDGGYIE